MKKFRINCPGCGLRVWPVEADSREIAMAGFDHFHQEERPDCDCQFFELAETSASVFESDEDFWGLNLEDIE